MNRLQKATDACRSRLAARSAQGVAAQTVGCRNFLRRRPILSPICEARKSDGPTYIVGAASIERPTPDKETQPSNGQLRTRVCEARRFSHEAVRGTQRFGAGRRCEGDRCDLPSAYNPCIETWSQRPPMFHKARSSPAKTELARRCPASCANGSGYGSASRVRNTPSRPAPRNCRCGRPLREHLPRGPRHRRPNLSADGVCMATNRVAFRHGVPNWQ